MLSRLFIISSVILTIQAAFLPDLKTIRHSNGRIIGGSPISITAAPYQVSLQENAHFCGGSIISSRWILSAAHCVNTREASQVQVRVGSSFHSFDGKLVNVSKIIGHPQFDPSRIDYDYALIELSEELNFSENIRSIALPKQDEKINTGSECKVSGWGLTNNPEEPREQLRAVVIPIVDQEECKKKYKGFVEVTSRMICAGLTIGGKDVCQQDSGGPLVHNKVLVGVVSWGDGCGEPNKPGVYANVAYIRDWIKKESNV